MPERAAIRAAGATRIPGDRAADQRLTTPDLSAFTRPQLERVAADIGVTDLTGTDADVRARILTRLSGA